MGVRFIAMEVLCADVDAIYSEAPGRRKCEFNAAVETMRRRERQDIAFAYMLHMIRCRKGKKLDVVFKGRVRQRVVGVPAQLPPRALEQQLDPLAAGGVNILEESEDAACRIVAKKNIVVEVCAEKSQRRAHIRQQRPPQSGFPRFAFYSFERGVIEKSSWNRAG